MFDEAIEEISRGGKPEDMQRTDQLVAALQSAFQLRAQDRSAQGQDGAAAAEGSGGVEDKPRKRLMKKKEAFWEPVAQAGQVHPEGREIIGKITVKEEVKEVEAPAKGKKASVGNAGGPGGPGAPGGPGGPGGSGGPAGHPGNGSSAGAAIQGGSSGQGNSAAIVSAQDEQEPQGAEQDGKQDRETAAAAQSIRSAGLQAPGLEAAAGNAGAGQTSQDFDVRSPATGASQTLTIRDAGKLGDGPQALGTYKRLDDSPALRYASLHSRGQGLEQTAASYAQEAGERGEDPEQARRTAEKLQSTSADG